MANVYEALSLLARRGASSFAELFGGGTERVEIPAPAAGEMAYRLRTWPQLPPSMKTAGVFRILSVMSQRLVNRRWMLLQSGLDDAQLDHLLQRLRTEGALEEIDTSRFLRGESA